MVAFRWKWRLKRTEPQLLKVGWDFHNALRTPLVLQYLQDFCRRTFTLESLEFVQKVSNTVAHQRVSAVVALCTRLDYEECEQRLWFADHGHYHSFCLLLYDRCSN
jgi:hypothetical protein